MLVVSLLYTRRLCNKENKLWELKFKRHFRQELEETLTPPSRFRVGTEPLVMIHLDNKAPFFHSYWADKARRTVKLLTETCCLPFKP